MKVVVEGKETQLDETGGIGEVNEEGEAEGVRINPEYFSPPAAVDEVENIDVSDYVKCHSDYPHALQRILALVQLK